VKEPSALNETEPWPGVATTLEVAGIMSGFESFAWTPAAAFTVNAVFIAVR
jgi:hypothetical protein